MRVETAEGNEVAVYDFGGTGPDVVFAHATGFHAHVWLPVVQALRDAFHCFGFDLRGHGDSDPAPGDDYAWPAFAGDCIAVLDALELEQPFGVGHSAGAAIELLAEAGRPGTFRALYGFEPVVMPPVPTAVPRFDNPLADAARRRREVFASRDAAYDNYASKPPFNRLRPDALRAYVDYGFHDLEDGTVRLKCRGENEARMYENGGSNGAFGVLQRVTCPTTVACGAQTDAFGPELVGLIAERMPRARTEVFPDLGHFGPSEDPDAVAASIRRAFLAG